MIATMSNWVYVMGSWGFGIIVVALYVASLVKRGRSLSASLPEEKRRWLK